MLLRFWKKRSAQQRRRLWIAQLEPRQLMAVTTSLVNGTLTITGDSQAEDVAIVGTANAGELIITGRNGTLVDGIVDGSTMIGGVTGGLTVDSAGGDDAVSLDNVYVARSIEITTAEGDDVVTLGATGVVSPAEVLTIISGAGNDQVYELNYAVFVGDSTLVDLGAGDDLAQLIGASAAGGSYGRAFGPPTVPSIAVEGRDGSDSILAIGVTAALALQLDGQSGQNSLALLNSAGNSIGVTSGYDPDDQSGIGGGTIYVDTVYSATAIGVFTRGFSTSGPFPDNSLSVFRSLCSTLSIFLGPGNNFVHVYGNAVNGPPYLIIGGEPGGIFPELSIYATSHTSETQYHNTIRVQYNVGIRMTINLRDDDDSLSLIGNSMTESTDLDTGGGTNDVFQYDNSLGDFTWHNQL
jgi:hypothetical protein